MSSCDDSSIAFANNDIFKQTKKKVIFLLRTMVLFSHPPVCNQTEQKLQILCFTLCFGFSHNAGAKGKKNVLVEKFPLCSE